MSFQVTTAHISTFRNNMQLALQQKVSKLSPYAMPFDASGKLFELTNLIGQVLPQRNTTRHGQTKYNDTPHARRWLAKTPEYYYAELVDTEDQLVSGIDLKGAYTMAAASTVARARDIAFLEGFYGVNLTGETGGTQTPFAAGNIVAVDVGAGGATGLNIAKLREAQRIFRANFVDLDAEELFMAVTAEQVADLQAQVEVTSQDFNKTDTPVIREGRLTKLMGFNFVEMEFGNAASVGAEVAALTLDGSGYRRVPAWAKSGMAFGTWGTSSSIDKLPQLQMSVQVWGGIHCAASRTEEGKCVQVLCSEA